MKVLHVYQKYLPDSYGGIEESIRQITFATSKLGAENHIFRLSEYGKPSNYIFSDSEVFQAKSWMTLSSCSIGLAGSFNLYREQLEWADLVHYHFPWPFADLMHCVVRPNIPSILTYHSDVVDKGWLAGLYKPLMDKMLNSVTAVVATSPNYLQSSHVLQNLSTNLTRVIPLGIDESTYKEYIDKSHFIDVYDKFGLEAEGFFLFIGALRKYKGIDTLIEAAKISNRKVVIVGSGARESHFRQKSIGQGNIKFLGALSNEDKVALIDACLALILPSDKRSEAFGMVLVEASMRSKPMITSELGTGTSYVNLDGLTGITVVPRSPIGLSRAMDTLFDNYNLRKKMGIAARSRYEDLFSGIHMGRSYNNLYKEVLGCEYI